MIQQGHRYTDGNREFLAMENTYPYGGQQFTNVCQIDRSLPYPLRPVERVSVRNLRPMPMAYFHGATPK